MESRPVPFVAPKRRALEIFLSLGASAGVIAAALGDLPPGLAQLQGHLRVAGELLNQGQLQ
ncbi:hypothetical protein NZK32_09105 [Cyanobium sp. FGCU-52]|nr:hypothetical protein [Cyanobium sp. FGCU52]